MNRNRLLLIGTAALIVAAAVSMAAYRILRVALASGQLANEQVVVAAADLAVGTRLEEKDLRLVKYPPSGLPQQVFHSMSEVVGRGVVLPMTANELVLPSKVAAKNAGAGLPALIAPGMRAVSVKVNEVVAVAGFVTPGTRVDVILTGSATRSNDPGEVTTTTVLENVQVLAAGQKLQRNENGDAQSVPVITLLVSPEDAQKLTLASSEGRIQLSLRNPLDQEQPSVPAVKNAALYGMQAAPAVTTSKKKAAPKKEVVPPPSAAYMVEMIRGDKRDVTKF